MDNLPKSAKHDKSESNRFDTVESANGAGAAQAVSQPSNRRDDKSVFVSLAETIAERFTFARDRAGRLYVYKNGVYVARGEDRIRLEVKRIGANGWQPKWAPGVIDYIKADAPELWETPPADALNLRNGILKIAIEGERAKVRLEPHTPKFLSAVQLQFDYDPAADCPAWDKQIKDTFPPDCVDAGTAYEICAWFMLPEMSIEKALLLKGPAGSGNSRFLAALSAFLGGAANVSATPLQAFEENRFAAVDIVGKLANICADLSEQKLTSTALIKKIITHDPIRVEAKGSPGFSVKTFARLAFGTNGYPRVDVPDAMLRAFFDRWHVVITPRVFRGAANERAAEKIDAELSDPRELAGVLNRALKALPRVRRQIGLTVTDSMREALAEFWAAARGGAAVRGFVLNYTVADAEAEIECAKLLKLYEAYAAARNLPPCSRTALGKAVARERATVRVVQHDNSVKDGARFYAGLRTLKISVSDEQTSKNNAEGWLG